MATGITISFGGYSVAFTAFESGPYTSEKLGTLTLDYSQNGALIRSGPNYKKRRWQFTAKLPHESSGGNDTLTLMRLEAMYQASPGNITVHDYTKEFTEPSPRTRALASGATASDDSTSVLYFAQFNAELSGGIQIAESGVGSSDDLISIELFETEATS